MKVASASLCLVVSVALAAPAHAGLQRGLRMPSWTPFTHDYVCYDEGEWAGCYLRQACYKMPVTHRSFTAVRKQWRCRWVPQPYEDL